VLVGRDAITSSLVPLYVRALEGQAGPGVTEECCRVLQVGVQVCRCVGVTAIVIGTISCISLSGIVGVGVCSLPMMQQPSIEQHDHKPWSNIAATCCPCFPPHVAYNCRIAGISYSLRRETCHSPYITLPHISLHRITSHHVTPQGCVQSLDYTLLKAEIMPRVYAACMRTTAAAVRIQVGG
jgi:hypothetical protein